MLERGPSQPLFEDAGVPEDLDEEFGFCEALRQRGGGGAAGEAELEATFGAHRKRHVTEETIWQVKALGLNCVRVPFGYWVVTGPTRGDPYCGPCMEHLDNVVQWCEKHGLQVLLDLHGNPGGESGEKPCGKADATWTFNEWRRDEAIHVLRVIAGRFKDFACVAGIQVANETGRKVDPKRLCQHYVDCAKAIREAGMAPDKVAVVCPYYFLPPPMGTSSRHTFLRCWRQNFANLDHCILDVHYYYFDDFNREVISGSLASQVQRNGSELDSLPAAVVGEFSAMRPPNCSSLSMQDFFSDQIDVYLPKVTTDTSPLIKP